MIVGLGETGISCAKYFAGAGVPFSVMDDNPAPPRLAALRELDPQVRFSSLVPEDLLGADEIIVSPGVPLALPVLVRARKHGVPFTGDVAMFGDLARAPIAVITGSNGKSTVTALLGHLASRQRPDVGVGGNIGTPCLDLLSESASLYIIEVSSFQLELADRIPAAVSVVLNLLPDHLDRYGSVEEYYSVKANAYNNCTVALTNRDTVHDLQVSDSCKVISFGSDSPPGPEDFGLSIKGQGASIVRGSEELIAASDLPIPGRHNVLNIMAALALGSTLGLDMPQMLQDLQDFHGLAHRLELVGVIDGVDYYNDSKATNVSSTVAAVDSLAGNSRDTVLILGGIGKGADFTPLATAVAGFVRQTVVFGRDRQMIVDAIAESCPCTECGSLTEAFEAAHDHAREGDAVLFSPACASQDMFEDYRARGNAFKALVEARS